MKPVSEPTKKGKTIYISRREARAIVVAISAVRSNIEAGAEQPYITLSDFPTLSNFENKLTRKGLLK